MQLLNGSQAVANAISSCNVQSIIGHGAINKAVNSLKSEDYQPELLDLHGDSASSAAASRALTSARSFIEDAQELKGLALARIPAVCSSVEPKNWSIVLAPANAQETFDDVILSYAIAEKALLPTTVIVGKLADETFETVDVLPEKIVKNFLGVLALDKSHARFARSDLEGLAQVQKAMDGAKAAIPKISQEWKKRSRRTLELFETFMIDDAELVLLTFGPSSTNAKLAVQELRKQGEKVGLIRLHVIRPWPEAELHSTLQNVSRLAVIDNQISLGNWSKLYQGIKTWYTGFASNFITDELVTVKDFMEIARRLKTASAPERIWMI